ncbi:protease modulator HflC [Candidatus Fermentibacterales bacterium]|nr:protease modulator HflC [Candidatus Fermentibacterales bacterium]
MASKERAQGRRSRVGLWALLVLAALLLKCSVFVVKETEQAVVLQFGRPVRMIVGERPPEELAQLQDWIDENSQGLVLSSGAGLYFKIPVLQQVRKFEDQILEYDDAPQPVVTMDKKHLEIDCYARWHIDNPLLFLQTVQTESEALSRLDDIIYSMLRQELGRSSMSNIIRSSNDPVGLGEYVRLVGSASMTDSLNYISLDAEGELIETISLVRVPQGQGRVSILDRVTSQSAELAREYGIEIIDVRIKRADLPDENAAAVFNRMQAERNRISARYRAEGRRIAQTIRAETDLRVDSIMANAQRTALNIRGQADSTAAAIYAAAYSVYPDFYTFMKSLEVLSETMDAGSALVLSTQDGSLLDYLTLPPGTLE